MFSRLREHKSHSARPKYIERHDLRCYVYAVGDIHGCYDQLVELQGKIDDDLAQHRGPALVVYLGDYVDRGSNSASVLDLLSAPNTSGHDRIHLCGNHEEMMLDFVSGPRDDHQWLRHGGDTTLRSYGLDPAALFQGGRRRAKEKLISYIPTEHLDFMRILPACLSMPGMVFVHAGLAPSKPLDEQSLEDMLWMRTDGKTYVEQQQFGRVIHGHTPHNEPIIEARRICVDTGAYATGKLSAVRISPDGMVTVISASQRKSP